MFRMRALILIARRQRVLIEIAANGRWRIDCICACIGIIGLILDLADEFLEILVDVIGGAIAEQLVDLVDILQQVGCDVPIEELEIQSI